MIFLNPSFTIQIGVSISFHYILIMIRAADDQALLFSTQYHHQKMENYLQLLHVSVSSSGYHLSDYHFVSKNPIIPFSAGIKTQSTIKGWDSIISKKQGVVFALSAHIRLSRLSSQRPHSDVTGLNLSIVCIQSTSDREEPQSSLYPLSKVQFRTRLPTLLGFFRK